MGVSNGNGNAIAFMVSRSFGIEVIRSRNKVTWEFDEWTKGFFESLVTNYGHVLQHDRVFSCVQFADEIARHYDINKNPRNRFFCEALYNLGFLCLFLEGHDISDGVYSIRIDHHTAEVKKRLI